MRRALLPVLLLLVAAPPLAAQEWSAEQQEVVDWMNTFAAEAYADDVDAFLAWLHPDFTAWDYAAESPVSGAAFSEMATGAFQAFDSITIRVEPVSVQVLGDVAVLHTWYREVLTGAAGEMKVGGRWTVVLKRLDGDWKHVAWTWTQEETPSEETEPK